MKEKFNVKQSTYIIGVMHVQLTCCALTLCYLAINLNELVGNVSIELWLFSGNDLEIVRLYNNVTKHCSYFFRLFSNTFLLRNTRYFPFFRPRTINFMKQSEMLPVMRD